ncbi:MAG TPA: DUF433 domain-containing protein [Ktedonobacterales bacterium]
MSTSTTPQVIRTERGLSITGTRITLYDIMDYLTANWPIDEIRAILPALSDEQFRVALDYIETHRPEVEAEYQQVLIQAEENRRYWEERNRERLARIESKPPSPEVLALRARLGEQKTRRRAREAQEHGA